MRIVFMGTPEFAVPTLAAILDAGYDVVGVITATDKWIGRGKKKLSESAVKKFAKKKGLHIMQPKNLKSPKFNEQLRSLKADIQIVVAFRMLPEMVWNMPPMGTYNLHGSLLPAYRGAAPIHWAVANGERFTGMSTFKLKHEIDTGTIALQDVVMIPENFTTGDIHDVLMLTGANLMVKTLQQIETNTIEFTPQNEEKVSHAPKVFHEQCELDLSGNAASLLHFIHGMSPFPGAWTYFQGKKLKIYRATLISYREDLLRGIHKSSDGKAFLTTRNGSLELKLVQLEGKPRMNGTDFANGYL